MTDREAIAEHTEYVLAAINRDLEAEIAMLRFVADGLHAELAFVVNHVSMPRERAERLRAICDRYLKVPTSITFYGR